MESILSGTPRKGESSSLALVRINLLEIRGSIAPLEPRRTLGTGVVSCAAPRVCRIDQVGGGGTLRAAKMGVLDVDHPTIRESSGAGQEADKAAALQGRRVSTCRSTADGFNRSRTRTRTTRSWSRRLHAAVENGATRNCNLIARATGEPIGDPSQARH